MPPIYDDKEMRNHLERVVRDKNHWVFVAEGPDSTASICAMGLFVCREIENDKRLTIDQMKATGASMRYGSLLFRLPTRSGIVSFLSIPKKSLGEDTMREMCLKLMKVDTGDRDIIFLSAPYAPIKDMEETLMGQLVIAAYNGKLLTHEQVENN